MASKQLGKLRQWGREVMSSKDKTVVSEEFKQVERDVDLRRLGIERLQATCTEYHGYLHKKKEYPLVEEGVKMLPIDALGAVMMSHGEEFGQDSAFGQNLVRIGRAHCKIATLQETFASTFRDTYLAGLNEMLENFSEYSAHRRKLESRRLTYDAAVTKANKAKKEKEVIEAEEEVEVAKKRYEETSAEVRSRMRDIQDNEIRQLRDLTELLTLEVDFARQYLDILMVTQEDWVDATQLQQPEKQPEIAAPHAFAHERSTPSISSMSSISKTSAPPRPPSAGSLRASDDEGKAKKNTLRRRSLTATPPPRPSSRNSVGSTGTAHDSRRRRDSVDSEGASNPKRMTVTGWASSAVSSFSRRDSKKEKIKDKDKSATRAFANLENESDDSHDDEESLERESDSRSRSISSFGTSALSKMLGQGSRSSSQSNALSSSNSSFNSFSGNKVSNSNSSRKILCALYDFDGSTDQLSFKAGDEIAVIYEGRDGWSMGELAGKRGLFPTSYVGDTPPRSRPPPLLPVRQTSLAKRAQIETASEDDASIISETSYPANLITPGLYNEPFGKFHLTKSPTFDDDPRTSTEEDGEEEGEGRLRAFEQPGTPAFFDSPVQDNAKVGVNGGNKASQGTQPKQPPALPRRSSTKKAPPPPPARRSVGSSSTTANFNTAPFQASIPAVSTASASFPSPPSIPKRPKATPVAMTTADVSVSPFDN